MKEEEFLYLTTRLNRAFPSEPWDDHRFQLYYEYLGNSDPAKLSKAVDEIIRTQKWFPRISEILERMDPPKSKDEEYLTYLDRCNRDFEDQMKRIEYDPPKEEAKKILQGIYDRIEKASQESVEERQKKFEERKKILEAQKKLVLDEGSA